MSVFAGPEIVGSGLVLCLDAANTKSYPGSGTTWTDLSGGNNTGTFTNGPTFSSANSGSIVFNGSNNFIEFGDVLDLGTNDLTICSWIKLSSSWTTDGVIISKARAAVQNYRFSVGLLSSRKLQTFMQGNANPDIAPVGNTILNTDQWYMCSYVFTRSSSITMYLNAVPETFTGSATISQWNGLDFQSINPLRVGTYTTSDNQGTVGLFNGNIANVQLYFRSLSAQEIQQNFNAQRGRFGI